MGNWKIATGAALALLAGLAIASQVDAGWFHHRHHGPDPERMREHAYRMVSHAFDSVDATEEQHEAARAIVDTTLDQLAALRLEHGEMRDQVMALLTAETIDRDAIEALRAEKLASADRASRVLTDGLVQLAEVLTPEQRARLPELREEHRAWH